MIRASPAELAERLAAAEQDQAPIETYFSASVAGFDAAAAWATARARDDLRRNAGEQFVGYKLGWTSAAMREAMGIGEPNWGSLWSSQRVGDRLALASLIHPKLEPEIAYRAATDIDAGATAPDVMSAADGWALAFEVVDTRFSDYRWRWEDNTADNSSAARYALGTWQRRTDDPADWEIRFDADGERRRGRGEAAMGSPAAAVAWLVAALAAIDQTLHAGEIVLTGGLTAPIDLAAGQRLGLESPELGSLDLAAV